MVFCRSVLDSGNAISGHAQFHALSMMHFAAMKIFKNAAEDKILQSEIKSHVFSLVQHRINQLIGGTAGGFDSFCRKLLQVHVSLWKQSWLSSSQVERDQFINTILSLVFPTGEDEVILLKQIHTGAVMLRCEFVRSFIQLSSSICALDSGSQIQKLIIYLSSYAEVLKVLNYLFTWSFNSKAVDVFKLIISANVIGLTCNSYRYLFHVNYIHFTYIWYTDGDYIIILLMTCFLTGILELSLFVCHHLYHPHQTYLLFCPSLS